jgi:asparagine synthase (glutamine-hydrolysing)
MPGIFGIITKAPTARAQRELNLMLGTLRHEAFYVTGTLIDESLGLYLGWTARRPSFADELPIENEMRDVSLLFSGEDFAEPGLRRRLREKNHTVAIDGADYLVHEYEENPEFFARLNGRFHGLVVDRRRNVAILFNDRFGMQRLYYHEAPDAFYFAAEAKAILAVRPELRHADERALGEYVACGCVLENRTFFENIHVLPPASAWEFEFGKLERKNSYFDAREWEEQEPVDEKTYFTQIREVFSRTLPQYFSGQNPVGVSLTGGLDTRMIMAWYKANRGALPCYSFGGMFRECQDVVLARRVAETCGQTHEVISVGDDFLARFADYAARTIYLTDGCVDVRHSPDLYANQRAREIAPVRMTGNYGGEVLRRVRLFKPMLPTPEVFQPEFQRQAHAAKDTFDRLLDVHPLSFALFRQSPWHHYGLLSLEQSQLTLRSPYLDNDFVRTVYRAPQSACTSNDVCLRLIEEGHPKLATIRTDLGITGRNSSIDAATRQLLVFTFKAEYAYDYGMPQWVATLDHRLASLHLDRLFLGRHKFYHFRIWYRDALAQYVREMLLDSKTLSRPYLDPRGVETIVRGHLKGNRNYTTAIHKVLTLELLHRQLLD